MIYRVIEGREGQRRGEGGARVKGGGGGRGRGGKGRGGKGSSIT